MYKNNKKKNLNINIFDEFHRLTYGNKEFPLKCNKIQDLGT